MSQQTLTPDAVHVAELRLLAARSEFRDAVAESTRAREALREADLAYRRLADPHRE